MVSEIVCIFICGHLGLWKDVTVLGLPLKCRLYVFASIIFSRLKTTMKYGHNFSCEKNL